jgi:hypothetical protein
MTLIAKYILAAFVGATIGFGYHKLMDACKTG